MNILTNLFNRLPFRRKRRPFLHEPIKFQELSFAYPCSRCPRIVHTTITWQEWNSGKVRELQTRGLCQECEK